MKDFPPPLSPPLPSPSLLQVECQIRCGSNTSSQHIVHPKLDAMLDFYIELLRQRDLMIVHENHDRDHDRYSLYHIRSIVGAFQFLSFAAAVASPLSSLTNAVAAVAAAPIYRPWTLFRCRANLLSSCLERAGGRGRRGGRGGHPQDISVKVNFSSVIIPAGHSLSPTSLALISSSH